MVLGPVGMFIGSEQYHQEIETRSVISRSLSIMIGVFAVQQ